MIPLRHKLKYMLGPRFDSVKHMQNGVTVARGLYFFLGFYWFSFAVLWKWPLPICDGYATGLVFSGWPNPNMDYGSLMWTKSKDYLRFDFPRNLHHATQVQTANREYER